MSSTTPNLNLVKLSGADNFSNTNALAGNWEKIDEFAGLALSRMLFMGSAQTISTATNFNDLIDIKNYVIGSNAVAAASANCPSQNAGKLCTWTIGGGAMSGAWAYGGQIYVDIVGRVFMRTMSTNGSGELSAGSWQQLAVTGALSTVDVLSTIATTFTAIDTSDARIVYTKQGVFNSLQFKFKCSSAITTGSVTLPTSVTGSLTEVESALASLDGNGGMAQLVGRTLYIRCGASSTNFLFGQLNWVA